MSSDAHKATNPAHKSLLTIRSDFDFDQNVLILIPAWLASYDDEAGVVHEHSNALAFVLDEVRAGSPEVFGGTGTLRPVTERGDASPVLL